MILHSSSESKFMIKNILIVFIIMLSGCLSYAQGYDMSVPIEGNSIANDTLQSKVLKDIYSITSKLNPVCLNHKVIDTQVLHYPYNVVKKDNKYIKGYWKELWTVDYCGEKVQIPVTFTINKKKTYYTVDEGMILN